jgi:apolipoprotein N-acyltransferase
MKKRKSELSRAIALRNRWIWFAVFLGLSAIGMTWSGIEWLSFSDFAIFCLPGVLAMLLIMFYCFKRIREIESDINTRLKSF